MKINILFEDNHILVVEKPVNIGVQEDTSQDKDLLTILKEDIKKRYQKPGNVFLALVHRLDRPVGGIMVFAKTSKAAARLSEQVRMHQMCKCYHAVICQSTLSQKGTLKDYLLKDSKTNTSKVVSQHIKNSKEAILNYEILDNKENLSLVKIDLITGRAHQIRVQFANRNCPLWGDQRYNKQAKVGQQIALFASSLSIIHPISKETMTFHLDLPNRFPFNLF